MVLYRIGQLDVSGDQVMTIVERVRPMLNEYDADVATALLHLLSKKYDPPAVPAVLGRGENGGRSGQVHRHPARSAPVRPGVLVPR